MSKVIVLGAKGRFGRAAVHAFLAQGWNVRAFVRGANTDLPKGVERFVGDAFDADLLRKACEGCDIIVNALNLPYENWAKDLPRLTLSVITAAKANDAHVLIPGNVYNYGENAPEVLCEDTPWEPTTRKGKLRVEMETAYRTAGVRTIVLRSGDFIEREKSGNWFDAHIAVKSHAGKTMYPGPLGQMHAWAYLPDAARAAVMLADKRAQFSTFEEFGFEGFSVTGTALIDAIAKAVGRKQKVTKLPWALLWMMGRVSPAMREIYEMRYLWRVPHRVDGQKLAQQLPEFQLTPLDEALRAVLNP